MTRYNNFLDNLLKHGFRVSRVASIVSGIMILVMAFVIAIDITGRAFFSWTLKGADEFAGYTLAVTGSLALTHALFHKRHIRVDSALVVLKKWRAARSAMDIVAVVALAFFIFPLTALAIRVFLDSWRYGSRANTIIEIPLIYPQSLWVFGFLCFSTIILLLLVRSLIAFLQGDFRTVTRLVGMRSASLDPEENQE